MNDLSLGWLIGIIDGEGCLTVRIQKHKTLSFGIRSRFTVQLGISNTNKFIIDRIEEIYKSLNIKYARYGRDRTNYSPNSKYQWEIIIYANALRILLPLLREYSMKQEEIDILLQFLKEGKRRGSTNPYTKDELLEREKLRQRLIKLHGMPAQKLSIHMPADNIVSDSEIKSYKKELHRKIGNSNRLIRKV